MLKLGSRTVGRVLSAGPIVEFEYLELRREAKGHVCGINLGVDVIKRVTAQHNPSMLLLQPFPIQYKDEDGLFDPAVRKSPEFRAERNRLARYYEQRLGCTRIKKGSSYWALPLGSPSCWKALPFTHLKHGSEGSPGIPSRR